MNIENKKFLDNILKNAPLYIFFVDNNCKIQYANDQFAKLMGYTNADEILSKEPEEILGIKSSYIRKVIDSGAAIINKPREALIDKNGNAMYFSMSCIPITENKTGKIIGAYEILHDITELQKKEMLANQIIENMPYPVHLVFFGPDRKIQYADKEYTRLVGYKRIDEIKGKNLREVLSISDETELMVEKVFDTNNPIINKEMKIKSFDNKRVHFSCSCMPINDAFGNLFGVLEILSDITELKNKENLIQEIIKNIPYPTKILFVDNDYKIQYANDEFAKLRGYANAREIIGKEPEEILGVKSSYIREVINTGKSIINKKREPLINKDNALLHHIISIIPIQNTSAEVIGALEILHDVTKLIEQKMITEQIIKNIPYPIHLAFFDPDRKIQYADKDYTRLLGYKTIDEIIGKSLQEVSFITDERRLMVEKVFETKKPILNKEINIPLDLKIQEKSIENDPYQSHEIDNNSFNTALKHHEMNYIHAIFSCIPLINDDKNIVGVLESFTDITNIKYISKKLKIHQEMYLSLIRSIDCSVYVVDRNCTYLYINPHYFERFKGFKLEEIIGKSYDKFHTALDSKQIKEKVEEVFNTGRHIKYIYHSLRANRYFDRILSPINDTDGEVFAVTVFSNEITELKNIQNNLIMKNKELEDYAYTVAHDLKTPLITIQGFANILEESIEQNNKKDIVESLKYIKKSISKMDELLSDTLKLTSIDYDKNSHELISFDNITINAIEQLRTQIETRSVKLIKAQNFPVVFVNKLKITEMLINLVENSIKYIGEDNQNPVIEIGYKGNENNAVFFVKDNGIGIDSSQHEKIFNVFYKIDTNVEGTGVGLAIVKKIINTHNGEVWVKSELRKGTTIFFTLPMME